jgi:hypothetical protein
MNKSKRQEKEIAKEVNGRRRPFSGARLTLKGDVFSDRLLIECKRTEQKSLNVKVDWLDKIYNHANGVLKIPAVVIDFDCARVKRWVMLPWYDFLRLIEEE